MWAPQPFFSQSVVLLADYNSFCSSYLAAVLSAAGVRTIGPFASEEVLERWCATAVEMPNVALVALDAARETHKNTLRHLETLGVPCLLVQNAPWLAVQNYQASFSWPYGAFQVVDALQELMRTAISEPTIQTDDAQSA
ncbi:hypothetical protein [Sphingomonas xinjiangensis]|uniref:Uncharacterized protein n=1 Tax=Sphingomonas xinjiangensis TaxID=643568 RepID=A0A840YJH8_9SPHN|nr:hypothetical protein [Sphingomonas xinjiangensis]MBB5712329.1 hypothetical protein [Sphingomonas xinjiangensis]